MPTLTDLRAERDALWQRMGHNFAQSARTPALDTAYDRMSARHDELDAQIGASEQPAGNPRGIDRTGVVDPGTVLGGRADVDPSARLLRPGQKLAAWQGNRDHGWDAAAAAEPGSDEEVRFGAMVRAIVTGRRDGLTGGERNALSEGTSTAGGHLVPAPTAATFIDRARAKARVVQAGATTVPMDSQTLKVPRLTGSTAPAWRNENAAIASGDLTFDAVTLTARSLAFIVTMSWELLEDASTPEVVRLVEDDLSAQVALEIDRVGLRGTGTAPEPRGVRNTSGVAVTAFGGANGAAPTNYDHLIDAVQVVRASNFEPSAIVQSPRSETTLAKAKETSTGAYLRPPAALDDVPRLLTNQIPGNLTAGTSTDTSEVYVGDWRHLYLGIRTGPMTFQLKERYADLGQAALVIWYRGDVAVAQPGAFNVLTGVRP